MIGERKNIRWGFINAQGVRSKENEIREVVGSLGLDVMGLAET